MKTITYLRCKVEPDKRRIPINEILGEMRLAYSRYSRAPRLERLVLQRVQVAQHLSVLLFEVRCVFCFDYAVYK